MVDSTKYDWPARVISQGIAGRLRAGPASGRIHSVFTHAVNLLVQGELWTLAFPRIGALPNGVLIDGDRSFLALGLAPGQPLTADERCLSVPAAGLTIDLTRAAAWSPKLEVVLIDRPAPLLRVNRDLAMRLAAARAPRGGFGPLLALLAPRSTLQLAPPLSPLCESAHRSMAATLARLEAGDVTGAIAAARPLIGLGDGLTPSGDDFLVGLGAALRTVGLPSASAFTAGCARVAAGQTTLVAETLLRHAALGEYSGRLKTLLTTLLTGDEGTVVDQVGITLAWGATSGADCLLGVLVGLAVGVTRPVVGKMVE